MAEQRDFNAEVRQLQEAVKALGTQRDRLNREAGIEESRRDDAIKKLVDLGVPNAKSLSVAELEKLGAETRAELEKQLQALNKKVAEGRALMTSYEEATA